MGIDGTKQVWDMGMGAWGVFVDVEYSVKGQESKRRIG